MMLWIIFAVMTLAAVFAVLWPLTHKARTQNAGNDLLVYKDQLEEIDRDCAAGLIGVSEAEAARVEVSRRLLSAADAQAVADRQMPVPSHALQHRRAAAVAAVILVGCLPLGFYLMLGSPDIPSHPAFARAGTPPEKQSVDSLVSQVEDHLAKNPTDGAGWEVIAPVYMRLGRFDDATAAWRKAIAINGDTPAREASLGESLVASANGVVTAEAKKSFEKAVAGDPRQAKARYFIGLADQQDGNTDAAGQEWRGLLQDAPAGAPYVPFVRQALAGLTGEPAPEASGPSPDDVAAAGNMTDDQRSEMIQAMVAKLSDRLHSDGDDVDGWLRLVRAYVVLGNRDKAKDAVADAKRALSSHPDEVKRIDDLVKGLGLEG